MESDLRARLAAVRHRIGWSIPTSFVRRPSPGGSDGSMAGDAPDAGRRRSMILLGVFAIALVGGPLAPDRAARAGTDDAGGETAKDGKKSDAKDRGKADEGEKDDDDDDDESLADKAAERFPQPVPVGTLLHRTVLEPLESQPVLGHVAGVVRASDGTIDVVVNYGGFLGFNARPIAVPIDAMTLLGDYMEIVDFTPAQLKTFPTFEGSGTPVSSEEVVHVGLSRPSH